MLDQEKVELFDSKHRVAFDLMSLIAQRESEDERLKNEPRNYYLTLFHQCYKVVNGMPLEDILTKK
jgi:hypothetical protein